MEPRLGWTLLSRDALRRAETQLRDDLQGVRDEIGFLSLHQAYADRFFPGTSVLHTRLRYALFVPWVYERLMASGERLRVADALEKQEIALAGRLKQAGESGVIGGMTYPQPTTQPPSMVYWTAMATWRILRMLPDGSHPSRSTVHRTIAHRSSRQTLHDDDDQMLDEEEPFFASIPRPPQEWDDAGKMLTFHLTDGEKQFFRRCLISVHRPGEEETSSLLARLVDRRVALSDRIELWSPCILAAADAADGFALTRARQAAALSAIGRAVYAALVEQMRDTYDGTSTPRIHRDRLSGVIAEYLDDAMALDVNAITLDAPSLSHQILDVLAATKSWLLNGRGDQDALHPVYERAESRRKGRRARLSRSLVGREKRMEWQPEEHPEATPLHYRWGNVRQLLIDLQGEA